MRVALVIYHGDPTRGGAERYTCDLADALPAHGVEPVVVASSEPADALVDVGRGSRTSRYRRFCRGVADQLERVSPDAVHLMLPVAGVSAELYHPHAGVACERGRLVSWLTNPRRRAFAAAERQHAGDERTTFVALSGLIRDAILRHHPDLPDNRIKTVPNGVDVGRFCAEGERADDPVFTGDAPVALFVGNDWHRKGLDVVLDAMPRVPGLKLAVVGFDRPSVEEAMRKRASSLGLADRVAWLGKRSDLPALYRASSVFVHASRRDPSSLVTLEALATGTPVVGTPQAGAMETMTDGRHGRIVEAVDIAPALREATDDETNRRWRSALSELRDVLSFDRHVETIVSIYKGE
ncbi:MAG: glycosyltransferase family 4 protein [Planctomycetota bacterium]